MRVCLLAEEPTLPRWQATALQHLLEHTDAELASVVFNEHESQRTLTDSLRRALELREWAVVSVLDAAVGDVAPHLDRVPLDDVVDRDTVHEHSVEPRIVDGWKQAIPAETVETIAADADVAVRFGFGFLVGPILSALEYGVLSYHHGDLREYRGQPMGFWEFVHGEDTAGVTVQVLTDELDAGQIAALETVPIDDRHTWQAVRRRLFARSEDMLTTAVRNVRDGDVREPDSLGDLYTLPRGRPVATFAAKNAAGHVRERLD